MSPTLKFKLIALSLVFPVTFFVVGWIIAWYHQWLHQQFLIALLGFVFGIIVNVFCYSRKLFTLALFYTPLPLAIFMLTWWVSDIITSSIYSLLFATLGLLVGYWLNKELVIPFQFYKIKKRILAVVFLFFNIICVGFFLGIPHFNLILGFLAGNYLSIRVMSNYQRVNYVAKSINQGALFAALTMLFITLFSGFGFISDDANTLIHLKSVTGFDVTKKHLIQVVILSGILLPVMQYFITRFTAQTMLQFWKYNKSR